MITHILVFFSSFFNLTKYFIKYFKSKQQNLSLILSSAQTKMTTCHQDICPHMHFNKCYAERIRSIPVSFFPDSTIDSFTNVNVKCGKQYKSNIPSVAYENYIFNHEASNDDRNFIKDFYMENYEQDKMVLNNNIVNELKEEMYKKSAYVLAEGATKDYEAFQQNRIKTLTNARKRANSVFQAHVKHQKEDKKKNYEQNGYWLKKLIRNLEEVATNIIRGSGENATEKQKQFLLAKANLTANFLSQVKIQNPKNACDILEELRILMQKRKLNFFDQKEQQQLNKSITLSLSSQVSQSSSQNSMLSEETYLSQSNNDGEDLLVQKFWDFNELKKKWKLNDLEQVKQMIRRVFVRKFVFDAEAQGVRKRKEADMLNKKLVKIQNTLKPKQTAKKQVSKKVPQQTRKRVQSVFDKKMAEHKIKLSSQEESAKKKIVEGGRFDSIGQQFMRNKTYSQMFKNKQNQIKPVFLQKQLPQAATTVQKNSRLLASTNISLSK